MITLDYYQKQAEIFANIDLNSSWFSYSIETVEFQGKNYQVYCPLEGSKPYLIVRWIQSIFRSIFGCCCEHPHVKTASALLNVTNQAIQLLGQDTSNAKLLFKTLRTASSILTKLKNSLSEKSWIECQQYSDRLLSDYQNSLPYQRLCQFKELNHDNCFEIAHSMDWDKDDPVLFDPTYVNQIFSTIQAATDTSYYLHKDLKLTGPLESSLFIRFLYILMKNEIISINGKSFSKENTDRLRQRILAIMNTLNQKKDDPNFKKLYKTTFTSLQNLLIKNCLDSLINDIESLFNQITNLPEPIDWNSNNHPLFADDYVKQLVATIPPFIQSIDNYHPHLKNEKIEKRDFNKFIHFLNNLMGDKIIKDVYGNALSKANTDRLRQMILAIMNILNQKKDDANFERLYATAIFQICRGLENCSNGINTNIENIFTDLSFPEKGGSTGRKVRLSLQQIRNQIFRVAIFKCLQKSNDPAYYIQHEAASINYYFRQMASEFGLPLSVSALDTRFEAYALKDQEANIRAYFKEHYNIALILTKIWEEIHDPYTPSDLPKLFGNWVQELYKDKDQSNLLDEDGKYKRTVVLQFLESLKIIQEKSS